MKCNQEVLSFYFKLLCNYNISKDRAQLRQSVQARSVWSELQRFFEVSWGDLFNRTLTKLWIMLPWRQLTVWPDFLVLWEWSSGCGHEDNKGWRHSQLQNINWLDLHLLTIKNPAKHEEFHTVHMGRRCPCSKSRHSHGGLLCHVIKTAWMKKK